MQVPELEASETWYARFYTLAGGELVDGRGRNPLLCTRVTGMRPALMQTSVDWQVCSRRS